MPSISGIRDSRVAAHARALEKMDRGALFVALVETSAMVGNYLVQKWGGSYDVERTHAYLRIVADRQLGLLDPFRKADEPRGPITDGMGSASAAAAFGAKEFTQQDPRQWELTWHHNTGGNARPEHADLDGATSPADIGFDVDPGIGAPGCACTVEPTNPKGALVDPQAMIKEAMVAIRRLDKTYGKRAIVDGARIIDERPNLFARLNGSTIEINRSADWARYWEETGLRVGEGEGESAAAAVMSPDAAAAARIRDAITTATYREYGEALFQKMTDAQWAEFAEGLNRQVGKAILSPEARGFLTIDTTQGANLLGSDRVFEIRKWIAANLSRSASQNGVAFIKEAFAEGLVAKDPKLLGKIVESWFRENLAPEAAAAIAAGAAPKVRFNGGGEFFSKAEVQAIKAKMEQHNTDVFKYLVDQKSRFKGSVWAVQTNDQYAAMMSWKGQMTMSERSLRQMLVGSNQGEATYVHELAHAFSKLNESAYTGGTMGFTAAEGKALEEGLAEAFSRSWMADRYGMAWTDHYAYQGFVRAYEAARVAAGISEADRLAWYADLLKMTGLKRYKYMKKLGWSLQNTTIDDIVGGLGS